jgi:hypothetical protein
MKAKSYKWFVASAVAFSMLALPLYADEHDGSGPDNGTEPRPLSGGEEKVVDKIAAEFADFVGEDAGTLVEALRTGDELSYVIEVEQVVLDDEGNPVLIDVVNDDGTITQIEKTEIVEETVVVENTVGPQGFGNVKLAIGLAEATAAEDAIYKDIVDALFNSDGDSGILDMRADGMGWGEIYHAFDLKVGDVMSGKNSARPERAAKRARVAKIEKHGRPEKAERPDKPEKPQRPQKPEKPNRPGKG